jgi:SNF2 family DNA or RNA helicase
MFKQCTTLREQHYRSHVLALTRSRSLMYKHYMPKLAMYDIVLTTYAVLRSELHFLHRQRRMGYAKKYRTLPSPLPQVKWWRVCLDEAQAIQTTTANAASMALKLPAVHRWCISGTPIQGKGIGMEHDSTNPTNHDSTTNQRH